MRARLATKGGSSYLSELEKSYKDGFNKFLRSIEYMVKHVEAKQQILVDIISATDFKNLLFSIENRSKR